jgi:hypothetical protein
LDLLELVAFMVDASLVFSVLVSLPESLEQEIQQRLPERPVVGDPLVEIEVRRGHVLELVAGPLLGPGRG